MQLAACGQKSHVKNCTSSTCAYKNRKTVDSPVLPEPQNLGHHPLIRGCFAGGRSDTRLPHGSTNANLRSFEGMSFQSTPTMSSSSRASKTENVFSSRSKRLLLGGKETLCSFDVSLIENICSAESFWETPQVRGTPVVSPHEKHLSAGSSSVWYLWPFPLYAVTAWVTPRGAAWPHRLSGQLPGWPH